MTDKRFEKMTSCESYLVEDETTVYKLDDIVELLNELHEENQRLKEREKYVGDVKREELDRVFKMSIYEIAEAFTYYENRIKELEDKE